MRTCLENLLQRHFPFPEVLLWLSQGPGISQMNPSSQYSEYLALGTEIRAQARAQGRFLKGL